MIKRAVIACAAGAMASVALAPAAASAATTEATRPAVVQIATRATPINADGSVDVVMWIRCPTGLNAFEMDTALEQRDTFGSEFETGGFLLPCDDTRHRKVVNVSPAEGEKRFHKGVATIHVYVGLYDGVNDTDSEVRDSASVRLYKR
jgi:hypothetical protein